jgi:hypothetical protein
MIRFAVLVAGFMFSAVPALAQKTTLRPTLRAGDEFRLELIRLRENSSSSQQNGRSRTPVDVRVISAGPEGFVLDWTPGETTFDNAQVTQDPLLAAASNAVRGIVFRLTLNADGEFTGVANQAEVVPKLQSMLDVIVRELANRLPADRRQGFQAMISQVLSSSALIASATREITMYFGLNGVSLAAGETVEADMQVPNPLAGGDLPAKFRVTMESLTADSASLKTTTTYDQAALRRMTQAIAQQAGAPIRSEDLANLPAMQVSDNGAYSFDRTVGLMREVSVNRRISIANNSRYEGWQIRLLSNLKR